jgi:hypothetical protein
MSSCPVCSSAKPRACSGDTEQSALNRPCRRAGSGTHRQVPGPNTRSGSLPHRQVTANISERRCRRHGRPISVHPWCERPLTLGDTDSGVAQVFRSDHAGPPSADALDALTCKNIGGRVGDRTHDRWCVNALEQHLCRLSGPILYASVQHWSVLPSSPSTGTQAVRARLGTLLAQNGGSDAL